MLCFAFSRQGRCPPAIRYFVSFFSFLVGRRFFLPGRDFASHGVYLHLGDVFGVGSGHVKRPNQGSAAIQACLSIATTASTMKVKTIRRDNSTTNVDRTPANL